MLKYSVKSRINCLFFICDNAWGALHVACNINGILRNILSRFEWHLHSNSTSSKRLYWMLVLSLHLTLEVVRHPCTTLCEISAATSRYILGKKLRVQCLLIFFIHKQINFHKAATKLFVLLCRYCSHHGSQN